jgi:hypothetical protein
MIKSILSLSLVWAMLSLSFGAPYNDRSRYALTYCDLVRNTPTFKMFRLDTKCLLNVKIFKDQVK